MSIFDDGFEGLPHRDWAIVHDLARRVYGIREPWPVELAGHHLRWLQGERRIGNIKRPKDFPTTAVLAVEWNWPKWKVAEFIGATARWEDPRRPVDLVDLRGDRLLGANKIPTADRRQADGGPTAETDERRESTPNPDGGPTVGRRDPDVARGNSARIHRAIDQKTPPTPASGSPPAEAGSVRVPAPQDPGQARTPARPRRARDPAGESAVWAAYRTHHPHADLTPPKAAIRLLRSAIAEYGADTVVAVVRWAHESQDKRARFLQDEGFLGLDNLLRAAKLPDRVGLARKWAGLAPPSSPASPAPSAPALLPDLPPAVVEDLDRLPSFLRTGSPSRPPAWAHQPDPDRCGRLSTAVRMAFGTVEGRGNWAPLYADLAAARPRIAAELVTLHHPEAAK